MFLKLLGEPGADSAGEVFLSRPIKRASLLERVIAATGQGAKPEPDACVAPAESEPEGARCRVLLVEDNVINQKVALRMLA